MFDSVKTLIYKLIAYYRSKDKYPEDLKESILQRTQENRKLKIAILDDDEFPWVDALESRGFDVKVYKDYSKPRAQAGQKLKTISLSGFDIVLCDINGVGVEIYKDIQGVGVIEDIRRKNHFLMILAYTGSPGLIHKSVKNPSCIDRVFSKEWGLDDFLYNLEKMCEVFLNPAARWRFVRERLSYLGASERDLDRCRRQYSYNILLASLLSGGDVPVGSQKFDDVLSQNDFIRNCEFFEKTIFAAKMVNILNPYGWIR